METINKSCGSCGTSLTAEEAMLTKTRCFECAESEDMTLEQKIRQRELVEIDLTESKYAPKDIRCFIARKHLKGSAGLVETVDKIWYDLNSAIESFKLSYEVTLPTNLTTNEWYEIATRTFIMLGIDCLIVRDDKIVDIDKFARKLIPFGHILNKAATLGAGFAYEWPVVASFHNVIQDLSEQHKTWQLKYDIGDSEDISSGKRPPSGRTQRQHNFIVGLNKRRGWSK